MIEFPRAGASSPRGACRVRIGTSGYSFPDWRGAFYPPSLPAGRMLPFYAAHFDTVEVNYTFYHPPAPRTMESMVVRTPPDFRFFLKAHQRFTHGGDLRDAGRFLDGMAPLRSSGKLAGLLFQFPQSFHCTAGNRRHLGEIARRFGAVRLVVEFRHRSWATGPVFAFLEQQGLALAAVDAPRIDALFPRLGVATAGIGYVRFHSRNRSEWYAGNGRRYDYDYTEQDLREWLPLLDSIAARAHTMFVFFNNCHRGQAARNAIALKALLTREENAGDTG